MLYFTFAPSEMAISFRLFGHLEKEMNSDPEILGKVIPSTKEEVG